MANWVLIACLQKIALPTILLACTAFRPCLLSAVYLILLLLLPYIPLATKRNYSSVTGFYLRMVMVLSFLIAISQILFQVVLFALPPYGYFLNNCANLEKILRHVGFVNFDSISITSAFIWITPEVIMVFASLIIYLTISKLVVEVEEVAAESDEDGVESNRQKINSVFTAKKLRGLTAIGRYFSLLMLCVASSMRPSLIGAVYFIIFIGAATWWASYRELQRAYAWILKFVELVVIIQLFGIYAYQTQYIQELLPSDNIFARLLGLETIISVDCSEPRDFIYKNKEWTTYAAPITIYCMYYVIVQIGTYLRNPLPKRKGGTFSRLERASLNGPLSRKISGKGLNRSNTTHRRRWQSATRKLKDDVEIAYAPNTSIARPSADINERMPLIRGVSASYTASSRRSTASKMSAGDGSTTDNIPMQPLGSIFSIKHLREGRRDTYGGVEQGTTELEEEYTCCESVFYAICSLGYVIIRSSYLATNIIMMTWSITYHSWITLVLLMWANILWLFPNQRRSMLRSSPLLVLYAIFLLISQYIFSLDLTEEELPSQIKGYNLKQIGFYRPEHFKCIPLIVKSLFTGMFWVTMRQYMEERKEAKQTTALADMVSPLQVTMGAAMSGNAEEMTENQFVKKAGILAKKILTIYWIWVVAGTLFLSGITGNRITGFRIIYMALFLVFLFLFQASWRIWRTFMYAFWLIVIIYSMFILITIYTYQFDNFPEYWTKYLFIPLTLQRDMGLELYATAELFMRLLQPTFFVIISVIQMHYFHKDFLEMTKIVPPDSEQETERIVERPHVSKDRRSERGSIKFEDVSKSRQSFVTWRSIREQLSYSLDLLWLFLELHMTKVTLITAILVCAYDVAAIHIVLVVMAAISLPLGSNVRFAFRITASALISIMLLSRMIYQIEYIHHDRWDVNCTHDNSSDFTNTIDDGNTTITNDTNDNLNPNNNIAKWLGFQKLNANETLFHLLVWYILYIMISTFATVVDFRQLYHRQEQRLPLKPPSLMFPEITRKDADKDTWYCLKYLLNYGYYKFGVECSLLGTAIVVCFRTDVYAVIYGIWLILLCISKRGRVQKIWPFYIAFTVIVICYQYVNVVGLPPFLCVDFPWSDNDQMRRIQDWFFVMDNKIPPPAAKIILDFILLILLVQQQIVFTIEDQFDKHDRFYPGGSNRNVIKDADLIEFDNPVPDFVTTIHNWLDVWKRGVFIAFLWFILAVIFLTGTNRVNVFSIGYLIGTFIFLWQGSDLFLRPIAKIVKVWEHLIIYNVFVIMMKACLQVLGCILKKQIESYSCWAVEMFGIGCIRYFTDIFPNVELVDDIDDRCNVIPNSDVSLNWDLFCFACLIFQRRIFKSYYFFHIVDDTKAMTILASRGAELIEDLRRKHVKEQDEREKLILENIKKKMDRIKENQRKIQGPTYKEPDNHFVDGGVPLAQSSSLSSSCTSPAGYHTPISEGGTPPPIAGSTLQPPSPCSALMTVSLDGYLEPQRMSFESPPHSDLNQRAPSLDDSFPVFSPPPYGDVINEQPMSSLRRRRGHHIRQISIGPPWMGGLTTPRQSIISYASRSPQSHQTYTIFRPHRPLYQKRAPRSNREAIRSGDYYMFDNIEDEEDLNYSNVDSSKTDVDDRSKYKGEDVTLGELISTVLKISDFPTKTKILHARSLDRIRALRRASMPPDGEPLVMRQQSTISAPSHLPSTAIRSDPDEEEKAPLMPSTSSEPTPSKKDDSKLHRRDSDDETSQGDSENFSIEEDETKTLGQKFGVACRICWALIRSALLSLTLFLNKFSKNYRFVSKVLIKEKKILKERTAFRVGIRRGSGQVWQPLPSSFDILHKARSDMTALKSEIPEEASTSTSLPRQISPVHSHNHPVVESISMDSNYRRKSSNITTLPEIRILAPSQERGLDDDTVSTVSTESHVTNKSYELPNITEEEEMSSADQPVPVRLALSIWFVIISNSEIVCYFMVFLNQIKSASIISLPLPLMVFLWGTLTIPRPSKTFWVTMIAYVEVVVIIKCVFQFKFLPWNDADFTTNPFFPPRILGIERKSHYAVYDLLLLLVIFFHRSMLKSLGLWKTSYAPIPHFGTNIFHNDSAPLVPPAQQSKNVDDASVPSTIRGKEESKESIKYNRFVNKVYIRRKKLFRKPYGKHRKLIIKEVFRPTTVPKKLRYLVRRSESIDLDNRESSEIITPSGLRLRGRSQQSIEHMVKQDGTTSATKILSTAYISPDESENPDEGDNVDLVLITTEPHDHYDYFPTVITLSIKKHFSPVQNFIKALYDPTLRVATDVYAYMFMCDFFNFLVIIFGFSAFGTQQGDGGVQAYLKENKVPIPFLLMLILQFMLILIDRALFLRKFILGKIIFQFFSIIGVHIWMFFILPGVTERQFNSRLPPQMWYMVKCFYLLLSAYQIRSGYPTRILGNFLCKGYNYINYGLFKGFMIIPFLFELRTIMDWMWTDTSMTLFDWLKMEDIFANIFQLKCNRHNESEFPQERGIKKNNLIKYIMGGSALFIIIGIIWFPLVLFALGKSVGLVNIPIDITLEMRIGPYQSIYSMSAQSNQIIPFDHQKWSKLNVLYINNKDREATTFLSNYEFDDIAQVVLSGNSTMVWNISPPDVERLIEELNSTNTITIRAQYRVKRDPTNSKSIPLDLSYDTSHNILAVDQQARIGLMNMLKGDTNVKPITIPYMLPKFLKVTNLGEVTPVETLLRKSEFDNVLRNITIQLSRSPASGTTPSQQWWEIREVCSGFNYNTYLSMLPDSDCNFIQIYMFNEKKFPATLSIISGGGIISLYSTLVFFASRFVRGFFSDQYSKIMFEDLPNVDRIMQLCLDIYLVRESRELTLEEDLFAKLVFLYRSPETLIKWTRPKHELEGDDSERQPSIDN